MIATDNSLNLSEKRETLITNNIYISESKNVRPKKNLNLPETTILNFNTKDHKKRNCVRAVHVKIVSGISN